jgi:hypothetical protein
VKTGGNTSTATSEHRDGERAEKKRKKEEKERSVGEDKEKNAQGKQNVHLELLPPPPYVPSAP